MEAKSEDDLVWSKNSVPTIVGEYSLLHFESPRQYYALRTRAVKLTVVECLPLLEFVDDVGSDLTSRSEARWLAVVCRKLLIGEQQVV